MNIKDLKPGSVKIKGTIVNIFSHRIRNGNMMTEALIADKTGTTRAVFFSKNTKTDLIRGNEYHFEGKYELKYGRLALQQPKYTATGVKKPLESLAQAPYILPARDYPYSVSKQNSYSEIGTIIKAVIWYGIFGYFIYAMISSYMRGPVTQHYLYCWDVGNPSPHHLGYHVIGDHFCSDKELGK